MGFELVPGQVTIQLINDLKAPADTPVRVHRCVCGTLQAVPQQKD